MLESIGRLWGPCWVLLSSCLKVESNKESSFSSAHDDVRSVYNSFSIAREFRKSKKGIMETQKCRTSWIPWRLMLILILMLIIIILLLLNNNNIIIILLLFFKRLPAQSLQDKKLWNTKKIAKTVVVLRVYVCVDVKRMCEWQCISSLDCNRNALIQVDCPFWILWL